MVPKVSILGGGVSSHAGGSQGVECRLDGNLTDGDNGGLESHGEPNPAVRGEVVYRAFPVGSFNTGERQLDEHKDQAADGGDNLRNDRRNRRAGHPHTDISDQYIVQNNVDYTGDGQKNQRRAAVAQGTKNIAEQVEEHSHHGTGKYNGQIGICVAQDFLRRV